MFLQMDYDQFARPGRKAELLGYLYTSFTKATAFTPTDTMPLTARANCLCSSGRRSPW